MKVTIEKLLASFDELERAIHCARQTFETLATPPREVLHRIETYQSILAKQRSLADQLCRHVTLGEWGEVTRHVQLINGLSAMIRDDAREILAQAQNLPAESRPTYLS